MAAVKALALAVASAAFLAGCGDGGGEGASTPAPPSNQGPFGPPVSPSSPASPSNSGPTIEGVPATTATAGEAYRFQPKASDAEGSALTFSAANLPAWARLNGTTGLISGTPKDADVGSYPGITVSVSDGASKASLPPFAITVQAVGIEGRATLSWVAPTENTDGSSLTDLSSYRILYGKTASNLSKTIAVSNPSITTYVVENLPAGTWYFAIVAVNSEGISSPPSNVAAKKI